MTYITTETLLNSWIRTKQIFIFTTLIHLILIYGLSAFFYTKSGSFAMEIIQKTIIYFITPSLNCLQLISVVFFYGICKFLDDCHFMLGKRPPKIWTLSYFIAIFIFGGVFTLNLIHFYTIKQTKAWVYILQNCFIWAGFVVIFVFALWCLVTFKKCRDLIGPSQDWGPGIPSLRKSRELFVANGQMEEYIYRQSKSLQR